MEPSKADKSKKPSEDSKKLKAATAVKVRHILCEKQSKGTILAELSAHQVLEAMAKLKDVFSTKW